MMTLRRQHPIPLYQQLAATLRAQIESGQYGTHHRLPSERELSQAFGVSRMTVRQALEALTRAGLIYGRVGKGTFVSEPKIDQQLAMLTSFSEEIHRRGAAPSSHILRAARISATKEVASALQLDPKASVYTIARVRLSNNLPLAVEYAFLPAHLCPDLLSHDFARESLYNVLRQQYNWRLVRAQQHVEARLANDEEIKLLAIKRPAPILAMERITLVEQGFPIEYVRSAYRGDRYTFSALLTPVA
jgi:GntR family transcriptional regulator